MTSSEEIAWGFRKLLEEGHDFASLPIRTRLNDVEVARFAANKFRFPGIDIRARLFRHYPNGEVASHVIGYIGRLTQSDLKKARALLRSGDYTKVQVAEELEVSRHTLWRALSEEAAKGSG